MVADDNKLIWLKSDRHPELCAAERWSQQVITRMAAALERHSAQLSAISAVAVGGSLGRLEAHPGSDFDCLLVAHDDAQEGDVQAQTSIVLTQLATSGLKAPKASGIYRQAIRAQQLLETTALGSLDEKPAVFGARMQWLLDACPVYRPGACRALQRDILKWYGSGFHHEEGEASWTLLINDLGRYRHAYAGWQQFKFSRSPTDSWQLRQAKLRSSRMLTFASLIYALGETNDLPDKHERVLDYVRQTPLRRVADIVGRHDPAALAAIFAHYEAVHSALSDATIRAALVAGGPDSLPGSEAHYGSEYRAIHAHSGALMTALTDFLLDRREDWDKRFFVRLLF